MINDPTAQMIIKTLGISPQMINDLARSVVSIKIHGVKPD
jgi:hypothetical protein